MTSHSRIVVGIDVGIRNLAICILKMKNSKLNSWYTDSNKNNVEILFLDNFDICSEHIGTDICPQQITNVYKQVSITKLQHLLQLSLEKRIGILNELPIEKIIIEQQPKTRRKFGQKKGSEKCKAIEYSILMFFICQKNKTYFQKIDYQSGRKTKLQVKFYERGFYFPQDEKDEEEKIEVQTKTYSQRKKSAVKLMEHLLFEKSRTDDNINKWRDVFKKSQKKDDMADAALHALYYLQNKGKKMRKPRKKRQKICT